MHDVFDTAAECKAAEEKLGDDAIRLWNLKMSGKKLDTDSANKLLLKFYQESNALCVEADDPRLAK